MPFAVGVHVVYDDGATHTRLLLGRPYTPARTKWCRSPADFWIDAFSTWIWEGAAQPSLEASHPAHNGWFIKPRVPNWIFQVGGDVVALQADKTVREYITVRMTVVNKRSYGWSDWKPQIVEVHIGAMPSYLFPTHRVWHSQQILSWLSVGSRDLHFHNKPTRQ